ncbi:hypothetical protein BS50DRAFT_490007 [Corynespora cassiicola Philippines]|uniref:Helicase C-terminal domain-containing protein n=1 Tax=Corynespora cassiicola Philippines TaxID=1448308 RepID=A0A2T2NU43_CORCC|nr:hypothetical protein BS50DRAFT_490007 [Corynespora cassiicola Philippines]
MSFHQSGSPLFPDVKKYIALGCLHYEDDIYGKAVSEPAFPEWMELLFEKLPEELRLVIGTEAARLLEAHWIRMFARRPETTQGKKRSVVRVYLHPEDWGRRFIDRNKKSLKLALRSLLHRVDISPEAWSGRYHEGSIRYFDPWASAEDVSLFYLFNKLPSPDPAPEKIKNRYARAAVEDLLDAAVPLPPELSEELPMEGLKTRLYPYQARSAGLMVQREAAPGLQLDPRLEIRRSPDGETFYFGARDGSFLQEPRYYETNRGGILAESMGLGKTIICLAVILSTKGHMPRIPTLYQRPPPTRPRVGSLLNMAASCIGRYAIPGRVTLERLEAIDDIDLGRLKHALTQNIAHYEIPAEVPRMNRTTKIPPPRPLVMCSGTLIVVPRNLLHQWQLEIRKHAVKGTLKILVVDSVSKRSKAKAQPGMDEMEFSSDLPSVENLMRYDIVLFTRNRFEQEIQDGADEKGRRVTAGAPLICSCPYVGSSRVRDCSCLANSNVYESPLRKLHWLRIIIDEGHSFSSSVSNAVLVAKQLQAERRWVVSGTPAKNLVGVEVDMSTLDEDGTDPAVLRQMAIEQRKNFSLDDENTKAAKALGSLAAHFLMVEPWTDSAEGRLDWEEYVYRHEHQYRKTYSGFSTCFLRTLEGLVVKTRPEDVERDIKLPPMRHRTVYIKPCWFDKMTANLFIQVLRANAITSERSDVDYLFHKNSAKARHSLIRNLRQSNFTWTAFRPEDVTSTLETTSKYLEKEDRKCPREDANMLLESSRIISDLLVSEAWMALSRSHEVGMAIEEWPKDSEKAFALALNPTMIGVTQLLEGQAYVDSHILSENPTLGLDVVGEIAKAKLAAIEEAEDTSVEFRDKTAGDAQLKKTGVPSSCVGGQPLTSRKTGTPKTKTEFGKVYENTPEDTIRMSPVLPKKRKLTLEDELAELPQDSPLRDTRLVGTTSAKLSYLLEKVMLHQEKEKILIFYDGDNAAFYIAQCLEMLYVNHRIYARTLDNTKRSEYVALFNQDPDIRVLLIDVACGALGLNLNAASVVLIVNPINRPHIEAQAIKRAHRIGQTKEVLVETLVLEGTIEEAIFKHARKMSRSQHQEAKELEDDAGIINIIQNAPVLPIDSTEHEGIAQFAPLSIAQPVFGRANRHKFHKYGHAEPGSRPQDKPKKKARTAKSRAASEGTSVVESPVAQQPSLPILSGSSGPLSSIFGGGAVPGGSVFGVPRG